MHSIVDLGCIQCHVKRMKSVAQNQNNPLEHLFVGRGPRHRRQQQRLLFAQHIFFLTSNTFGNGGVGVASDETKRVRRKKEGMQQEGPFH